MKAAKWLFAIGGAATIGAICWLGFMTYSLDRRIDRIDRDSALYPQPESSDIAQQVQELASQIEENRRAAQNAEAIAHSAQEKANAACRNEHIYC